jgi:alkylated DNA repair dioxygenase AlkB
MRSTPHTSHTPTAPSLADRRPTPHPSTGAAALPEGLSYVPEYVDSAVEATLLAAVDAANWRNDLARPVQQYGWRYDYKMRRVTEADRLGDLPEWAAALARRLHEDGWTQTEPDQVIVNLYIPPTGIARHVDCRPCFGPTIVSLSLGSATTMVFTQTGPHSIGPPREEVQLRLEPRSLLVMTGPSRNRWAHAIPARLSDRWGGVLIPRGPRVSLTFRTVTLDHS